MEFALNVIKKSNNKPYDVIGEGEIINGKELIPAVFFKGELPTDRAFAMPKEEFVKQFDLGNNFLSATDAEYYSKIIKPLYEEAEVKPSFTQKIKTIIGIKDEVVEAEPSKEESND